MSFSSRRRNYLLTPHRRDGLIEWMKSMLSHSFVLDCLEDTAPDTFSHFEMLIDEHRRLELESSGRPSRLIQLVPTVGTFHTCLPLRKAFEVYNDKHRLTKRKHIQVSFNEIRHILNLAQVIAMGPSDMSCRSHGKGNNEGGGTESTESKQEGLERLQGPKMITFDGDQTLYSDGSNFDSNPKLANYLFLLLRHGVTVAVVTAAGYEYNAEKYEFRLSGLLDYFKAQGLTAKECERFYLFGGECNYLLHLGSDYRLHPVRETGPGGWVTATKHIADAPGNWSQEELTTLLDTAENAVQECVDELNMRGRVIRKKRAVGLVPTSSTHFIPREVLDETVLHCQTLLGAMNNGTGSNLPFCAFNGGKDVWVDVGNKRVAVEILASYLGLESAETLHIGDQFLNTGNDFAARAVCPCIWITSPEETTYILKTILRLSGVPYEIDPATSTKSAASSDSGSSIGSLGDTGDETETPKNSVDFNEMERRTKVVKEMDVYTGEIKK